MTEILKQMFTLKAEEKTSDWSIGQHGQSRNSVTDR